MVNITTGTVKLMLVRYLGREILKTNPAVKKKKSSMKSASRYSKAVPLSAKRGAITRKNPR